MKWICIALLWLGLPFAAWADGMVIPTVAYPAHVTIPDQRALIHFTNGTERLVIETRFTGAGTNFAWVVPFPNEPVIEAATTGLFPTLEYLFRPEIIHHVPRYYIGILFGLGFLYLFWRAQQSVWDGLYVVVVIVLLIILAAALLPALSKTKSMSEGATTSSADVSILDRKLVGIFETTTISARDPAALENWLRDNGFALPTNAAPVIASYVKGGWVFVASKIRRDRPELDTSTPHPLSFTFKTFKPVYPMQLTGLNNPSLTVALYVFGNAGASAPHFKVESCARTRLAHPLLRHWIGDSSVVTKLTATLSPRTMRQDIWLEESSYNSEKKHRLYSQQGALTIALNCGAGFFALCLTILCLLAFAHELERHRAKLLKRTGGAALAGIVLVGLVYLSLPKIDVKVAKGYHGYDIGMNHLALELALENGNWQTVTAARAGLKEIISNPTNAVNYGLKSWDNTIIGGQLREEDSPGNYLLRETNHELQVIVYNLDGSEKISERRYQPTSH